MTTSAPPGRLEPFLALSRSLAAEGRAWEALALCRAALALAPADAEAHSLLASLAPAGLAGARLVEAELGEAGLVEAGLGAPETDPVAEPGLEEKKALIGLFLEGRPAEAALTAQRMAARFPLDAFGWKVLGAARQQMGQVDEALAANRAAAAVDPADAEARFNLGVAFQTLLRLDEAEVSYRAALELKPAYPEALANLGNILGVQDRQAEAEVCYRLALGLKPDYAEAWNNLGVALLGFGRSDEAAESFGRAVTVRPDYAEAWSNLGNALKDLHRLAEAETSHRRALSLRPDHAEAWSNLGVVLDGLGRTEEALDCHRRAVELLPGSAPVHNNLGNTLLGLGRLAEAEASYLRAVALQPDFPEAHGNLGIVRTELGLLDAAGRSFHRALELSPDNAEVLGNLSVLLRGLNQLAAAEDCCREALEINPRLAGTHNNLGVVLKEAGRLDEARQSFREALALAPENLDARSNLLYMLHYSDEYTAERRRAEAQAYGSLAARKAAPFTSWRCEAAPRRLRVGLVSGDLRRHAAAYFLEGALQRLDPERIELIAYAAGGREDELTARIKPCFAAWRPLPGGRDADAARVIHADGPHLLLDLSGHTARNRLPVFAFRPAPAQATWLGYAATTGLAEMDCLLADPWTLPERLEPDFTEAIVRLPETRLCFTPPAAQVAVAPPPALVNGFVTFGCFNDLAKVNDTVAALWVRVLGAVPGSRLLLKAGQLAEPALRRRTAERFAALGLDPARLDMEGPEPRADYLAAYGRMDIALDPFPYPGGATSVEGLWMGVPLVTLAGESFLARQGVGILMNAGLADWIATDAEDYVAKAAAKAADLTALAALRAGLRAQLLASPLFDAARFARHLEDALWDIWRRWGLPRLADAQSRAATGGSA